MRTTVASEPDEVGRVDEQFVATTPSTGDVPVGSARRRPDGSWRWAGDETALVP